MITQVARSRFVESALATIKFPAITPVSYERLLLNEYIQGVLTIGQLIELLEGHTDSKLLSLVLAENFHLWARNPQQDMPWLPEDPGPVGSMMWSTGSLAYR
jgi:hypothetical protein